MPAPKRGAGAKAPALPVIANAKFRVLMRMLDAIVDRNTDIYVEHGRKFSDKKRAGTSRDWTAADLGPLARGLDTNLADARQQLVDAGLRAHDDAADTEILIAAGIGTAPELYDELVRLTLLVEMSIDDFNVARRDGDEALNATLEDLLQTLDDVPLAEVRERVGRAWAHIAEALGYQPGKAWGLIAKTIWRVVSQGMETMEPPLPPTSSSTQSTDSPAATAGPEPK